jgi:hypothetical protein
VGNGFITLHRTLFTQHRRSGSTNFALTAFSEVRQ